MKHMIHFSLPPPPPHIHTLLEKELPFLPLPLLVTSHLNWCLRESLLLSKLRKHRLGNLILCYCSIPGKRPQNSVICLSLATSNSKNKFSLKISFPETQSIRISNNWFDLTTRSKIRCNLTLDYNKTCVVPSWIQSDMNSSRKGTYFLLSWIFLLLNIK